MRPQDKTKTHLDRLNRLVLFQKDICAVLRVIKSVLRKRMVLVKELVLVRLRSLPVTYCHQRFSKDIILDAVRIFGSFSIIIEISDNFDIF